MNPSGSAPSVVELVRLHRIRLLGVGTFLAAAAIVLLAGSPAVLLLALPVLFGTLPLIAGSERLTEQVHGWENTFQRVSDRARSSDGKFSRYFLRPLSAGSLWMWKASSSIRDHDVRAGVRVCAVSYFWALMIFLLLSAVYLIVGLIMFVLVMSLVGYFMGWNDGHRPSRSGGWIGRVGGSSLMKAGLLGDQRTGTKINNQGQVVQEGILFDTPTGTKIMDDGRIVQEGILFDTPTGKALDSSGRLVDEGLLANTPTGLKINSRNEIVREGLLSDEPTGLRLGDE